MKKRGKRGQISVFIIIAVIIIAVAVIFLIINFSQSKTKLDNIFSKLGIKTQSSLVQSSILDCVENTARDSLVIIGIQGGYYNAPEKNVDLGWTFIPYYYYEGIFLMPTKEKIEQELSLYVDDNLAACLNELEYNEFSISYDNSKTTATIEEKKVSFITDLKITFKKDDSSSEFELSNHPVEIESALSDILEVASYITEGHKEDPEFVCISCVADMAESKNLYVDMLDFGDESSTLIVISENYTSSEPYVFEFLNKYV